MTAERITGARQGPKAVNVFATGTIRILTSLCYRLVRREHYSHLWRQHLLAKCLQFTH
jgi:hypothetical protein